MIKLIFTQRLVLKQRHKDAFIHELLTEAFDYVFLQLLNFKRGKQVNEIKSSEKASNIN